MMSEIKSGKEVIGGFFQDIEKINGVDKKTVTMLASLYKEGKLTDTNIENEMDRMLQEELAPIEAKDDKD